MTEDNRDSPETKLANSLSPVQFLRQLWLALVHVTLILGIFTACGLLALGLDYLLPLPWWGRGVLLVASLTVTVWGSQQIYGGPLEITFTALASRLETVFPEFKDRLVTAVEVAEGRAEAPESLRKYILHRGAELANRVTSFSLLDREYPLRNWLLGLVPVVICLIISFTFPEIVLRHGGRFLLPGARIPPVTATRLHLPEQVQFVRGEDVTLELLVTGKIPDRADLYLTHPDGVWHRRSMTPVGRRREGFVFQTVVGRPVDSFEFYVAAGDATSFTHRASVRIPPELRSPTVKIESPAYTGEPDRTLEAGPFRALTGSTVTLRTGLEPPGSQATANIVDTRTRTISLEQKGDTFYGQWRLWSDGHWTILPVSPDGVAPKLEKWAMKRIHDRPPGVQIIHPSREKEVGAVSEVPVTVQASDDYGLAEVQLRVGWDSGPATVFRRRDFAGSYPETAQVNFEIPLEKRNLEPGAMLTYRVEARDANTVSGPGRTSSSVHFLEVVPFDIYREWRPRADLNRENKRRMRKLILRLRKVISAQKNVLSRTVTRLARGSNPQDTDYEIVQRHQLNVRTAADSFVRALDKFLQQDNVRMPEEKYLALRDAMNQMKQSAKQLAAQHREKSLGHQRQAINLLNKVLQSMREIYRRSQSANSEADQSGEVSEDFEAPREDTGPRDREAEKAEKKELSSEVNELLQEAKKLLSRYEKKEKMEEKLSGMGPAALRRLRELLQNLGSLSPPERKELARMAARMNLTEEPEKLVNSLEKLARAGVSREVMQDLWKERLSRALKKMNQAGLSGAERKQITKVFRHLKPCRLTDTCKYNPRKKWQQLRKNVAGLSGPGSIPVEEEGDSLARLMRELERGGEIKQTAEKLGELAKASGYLNSDSGFAETLKRISRAGKLEELLAKVDSGRSEEVRSMLEATGLSDRAAGRMARALSRLADRRRLAGANNNLAREQLEEYMELARNADRLDTGKLGRLAGLAARGGLVQNRQEMLRGLRKLSEQGQLGQLIRQLARGQTEQARQTMRKNNLNRKQRKAVMKGLGTALNSGSGGGLSSVVLTRLKRSVRSDTGQATKPQEQTSGAVVDRIRNVQRQLRLLHRLLEDRAGRGQQALAESEREAVPEELRALVEKYFQRLNQQ